MARKKSEPENDERNDSMVRTTLWVPTDDKEAMRNIAQKRRCSLSDVMRQSFADTIKKENRAS